MPTMGAFVQWIPAGFSGNAYRSTDGTVFQVIEGRGVVEIGTRRFDFGPRDTFVVPSWMPYRFVTQGDETVLFSFSDRPVQQALHLWREERTA